jgi:hypothetical protein
LTSLKRLKEVNFSVYLEIREKERDGRFIYLL